MLNPGSSNHPLTQCYTYDPYSETTSSRIITTYDPDVQHEGRIAQDRSGTDPVIIYPNPAQDWCQVVMPDGQVCESATLTDILGRTIRQFNAPQVADSRIPLHGISNGMYILRIQSNAGNSSVHRLVISK